MRARLIQLRRKRSAFGTRASLRYRLSPISYDRFNGFVKICTVVRSARSLHLGPRINERAEQDIGRFG